MLLSSAASAPLASLMMNLSTHTSIEQVLTRDGNEWTNAPESTLEVKCASFKLLVAEALLEGLLCQSDGMRIVAGFICVKGQLECLVALGGGVRQRQRGLFSECVHVRPDKRRGGQSGFSARDDVLRLDSRETLHDAVDAIGDAGSLELAQNGTSGVVTKGLVEGVRVTFLLEHGSTTVEGLDVGLVETQGRGAVFDDLVGHREVGVAGGAVGIEDGLLLKLDGFGVVGDGLVVFFGGIELVALGLEGDCFIGAVLSTRHTVQRSALLQRIREHRPAWTWPVSVQR